MAIEDQRDLVLAPNEYAYVLDQTKGNISCWVGPTKTSLSQSDKLVRFDEYSKKFVACANYKDAINLFTSVPEGWYVALKNPAPDNKHPLSGTSNSIPENMQIGSKVMIAGPANFALYPGQMATVIKGHTLRSNQYLVARVYDALSIKDKEYINGQILIIKGTEVSFYIPPTGIEVIPIDNRAENGYVRDAVTLERLEYCILKDEDGNRRYMHGPEVVFPSPTEVFMQDGNGNIKRKAIELSDISGVYVKVIDDYTDDKGVEHKTGEELFITGKDQMIYYPRPEHTFITYNGRVMCHAIAIPKGEGRYMMNRLTGDIKTIHGPAMYLPDPRTEVTVKRTLTKSQCILWYPGNEEVLCVNGHSSSVKANEFVAALTDAVFSDSTMEPCGTYSYNGTPKKKESNKINRTNTFTPPRTISLNSSKYDGAVAIDVWTGYAVNVIGKDGTRKVVRGPQTILLDYDQNLETLELSTGTPKNADNVEQIVFLKYENNKVSDIIDVETKDFVKSSIEVSYLVNFDETLVDKWFSVDNYVKHLCDWGRSIAKKIVKQYSITELNNDYQTIIYNAFLDEGGELHKFNENGMRISDVEVLSINIEPIVQSMIDRSQNEIVAQALNLDTTKQTASAQTEILALKQESMKLNEEFKRNQEQAKAETQRIIFELEVNKQKAKENEEKRKQEALKEIQVIQDALFEAKQERLRKEREAELAYKATTVEIEAKREAQSAEAMKVILEAVGPELAASLNNENNQATIQAIAEAISPYAIAEGNSVSDAISKLLRGTTLEQVVNTMKK